MPEKNITAKIERLDAMERLADEISKEKPCEQSIKRCMNQAGLRYVKDPLDRLSMILDEIHFLEDGEESHEN